MSSIMSANYPFLNIDHSPGTGYIDYIGLEQMTHPVMIGYDIYDRAFVLIRAKITKSDHIEVPVFETFFQRYSDGDMWMVICGW
jgi:hypothetical protein